MNTSASILRALLAHASTFDAMTRAQTLAILPILERAHEAVLGKIAKTRGKWTTGWLQDMAADLTTIYEGATAEVYGAVRPELEEFAQREGAWIVGEVGRSAVGISLTVPAPSLLSAVVDLPTSIKGSTTEQLFQALAVTTKGAAYEAIQTGILSGDTVDQMTARLRGEVVKRASWKKGADGVKRYQPGTYEGGVLEGASTRSAEMVARTAVMHVGNQARETVYRANEDIIKGYQRVETLDTRTCLICGEADGRVYAMDEPRPSLPVHFDCLPGDALVSSGSRVAAVSKRIYDGDMIIIRTSSGNEIRATPNHPILTQSGFIPAQHINLRDKLVCDAGIDRVRLAGAYDDKVESRIEDLFSTFLKSGKVKPVEVPTTAKDFHGDGADDEVAVVATNRELTHEGNPSGVQYCDKSILVRRRERISKKKSGYGKLASRLFGILRTTPSIVRRFCPCASLLRGRVEHAGNLLLLSVSRLYASIFKGNVYVSSTRPEFFGNSASANASIVNAHDLVDCGSNPGAPTLGESISDTGNGSVNAIPRYADLAGEIIDGLAGPVSLEQVVDIRNEYFSGHVYNLQTEDGYFISGKIITHNCRGVYIPVLKSWKELGIDADEFPEGTRASMDGQVAASETFAERLEKASPGRLKAMLGTNRARLYEQGARLEDMVVDGRILRLDEIKVRRKEAAA